MKKQQHIVYSCYSKQNSCPTLILRGGTEDRIDGMQVSYKLKKQIAGSKLYVYPGLRQDFSRVFLSRNMALDNNMCYDSSK